MLKRGSDFDDQKFNGRYFSSNKMKNTEEGGGQRLARGLVPKGGASMHGGGSPSIENILKIFTVLVR